MEHTISFLLTFSHIRKSNNLKLPLFCWDLGLSCSSHIHVFLLCGYNVQIKRLRVEILAEHIVIHQISGPHRDRISVTNSQMSMQCEKEGWAWVAQWPTYWDQITTQTASTKWGCMLMHSVKGDVEILALHPASASMLTHPNSRRLAAVKAGLSYHIDRCEELWY